LQRAIITKLKGEMINMKDLAKEYKAWEKQHQNLFNTIEIIKVRRNLYREQNRKIGDLMGDFSTHLTAMDTQIESAVFENLDEQINKICGLTEMASYYFYECDKGGMIECEEAKKEFKIYTIEDVKKCVYYFSCRG
tara:strand:- start:163 stop:570 length:408 start_codon:yes stop_codon:yes gene_type:complete